MRYKASWIYNPVKWEGDCYTGHYVSDGDPQDCFGEIIGWTRAEDGPMAIIMQEDGTLTEIHYGELKVEHILSR